MADLLDIARIVACHFKRRAGPRITLAELESAALFGIARAIPRFDPTRGSYQAHLFSSAWYEVMTEIRDRHPDGPRKYTRPRTYYLSEEESGVGVLNNTIARPAENNEEAVDLIRRIRKHYGHRISTAIALMGGDCSYQECAYILRVSEATLYDWIRVLRQGPIGTELAERYFIARGVTGKPKPACRRG